MKPFRNENNEENTLGEETPPTIFLKGKEKNPGMGNEMKKIPTLAGKLNVEKRNTRNICMETQIHASHFS